MHNPWQLLSIAHVTRILPPRFPSHTHLPSSLRPPQVPEGAVPTSGSWPTRSTAVTLSPFSAQSLEQSFYFPHPGSFRHCPACIAEKGAVVARADPAAVTVAKTEAEADQGSWEWVSQARAECDVESSLTMTGGFALLVRRSSFRNDTSYGDVLRMN